MSALVRWSCVSEVWKSTQYAILSIKATREIDGFQPEFAGVSMKDSTGKAA